MVSCSEKIGFSQGGYFPTTCINSIANGESVDKNASIELEKHLNHLYTLSNDTSMNLELIINDEYQTRFIASSSFDVIYNYEDYIDSQPVICKATPTICGAKYSFDAINTTSTNKAKTTIFNRIKTYWIYHCYTGVGDPYWGGQVYFVTSFNKGKYLVITHRMWGPDIRSSMPPGSDATYYLERID